MLKSEFSRAIEIVQSGKELNLYEWMQDGMEVFDGFGLSDFKPVCCTLEDMARLIAYECLQFDGQFDREALSTIWHFRKRFNIVGSGSEECVQAASVAQSSHALLEELAADS